MRFTARLLAATALVSAGLAGAAAAQDFSLKFQSSDPAGNANFLLQQEWAKDVAAKTDGRVEVDLLPVETIVAHTESQDAVAAGIIDGHVTDTSYFAGKEPAFGLIANPVGAWSDPQQMFDFMENGGGNELMNEMLEPYGLHFIGATTPGLESFLSKVPLEGVEDLEGLKMRAPEGMVQNVFAAAGATPVNLPGSEVFTSLDKGVIDAADYSVFSTNHQQGMHDVATHPVYPGFHSMPATDIVVNMDRWNALPDDLKAILTVATRDFGRDMYQRLMIEDKKIADSADEIGLTLVDWPDEERRAFRKQAESVWRELAAESEIATRIVDSQATFLKQIGLL